MDVNHLLKKTFHFYSQCKSQPVDVYKGHLTAHTQPWDLGRANMEGWEKNTNKWKKEEIGFCSLCLKNVEFKPKT